MRSPLALGLIAATLAGCATPPPEAAADPRMAWAFDQTPEEGAKLAYGLPASDEAPVMLTCRPRSGLVRISAAVASAHVSPVLRLASKGVASTASGAVADDPLGPRLEATAPAQLPALAAFAESGHLTVTAGGAALTATAADPTPVRRFFAACRP
jgi:hypothetical protein